MPMIDPDGLFYGDRLRRCSQTARLYWPYLFLASNGFGRLELNYSRICHRVFVDFEKPPTEDDFWGYVKEYRDAHLLFLYEHRGQIWGQWDAKPGFLPRWKTKKDKETPEPPKQEYEKWLNTHHTGGKALPISSEILVNLTKTSEDFRTSRVEKSREEKCQVEQRSGVYDPVPGWEKFQQEYPGEVIPDRDCQVWMSVIESAEQETLLFRNLAHWKSSRKWLEGFVPNARNFLFEGHWKVQPQEGAVAKTPLEQTMEAIQ
jgi:hypothetical protein